MPESSIKRKLRNLIRDNKIIPFIGAGFSRCLKLPDWSGLIDIIARQLDFDPFVFKSNGNFLQLAEYYTIIKPSIGRLLMQLIRQLNPSDKIILSSNAHMALVDLKFSLIYTTNYDDILERAHRLKKKKVQKIIGINDILVNTKSDLQIVKFHGDLTDANSIILTESSYFERLNFEHPLDIKLRSDILGKKLLFMGYSLSDMNIRYMFYKLHNIRKLSENIRDDIAAFMVGFSIGEVQKQLLRKWNIAVIELDPVNKSRSIYRFLEGL